MALLYCDHKVYLDSKKPKDVTVVFFHPRMPEWSLSTWYPHAFMRYFVQKHDGHQFRVHWRSRERTLDAADYSVERSVLARALKVNKPQGRVLTSTYYSSSSSLSSLSKRETLCLSVWESDRVREVYCEGTSELLRALRLRQHNNAASLARTGRVHRTNMMQFAAPWKVFPIPCRKVKESKTALKAWNLIGSIQMRQIGMFYSLLI